MVQFCYTNCQILIVLYFYEVLLCVWVGFLCRIPVLHVVNKMCHMAPTNMYSDWMFVTVFGKCFTSFPSVSWYKKHWVDEHLLIISFFFSQTWTVALWLTHPMAKLVTLLEQHSDKPPPIVVMLATTWWETALVYVIPQEGGLGVHLPVRVCCC